VFLRESIAANSREGKFLFRLGQNRTAPGSVTSMVSSPLMQRRIRRFSMPGVAARMGPNSTGVASMSSRATRWSSASVSQALGRRNSNRTRRRCGS